MATRVFELARELGVTSKVILEKCNAEGLTLKNHMATLSAGLEATIREWFTEGAVSTAVETTAHVDLGKARAEARKQRRRDAKDTDTPVEEAAATETPAEAPAIDEARKLIAKAEALFDKVSDEDKEDMVDLIETLSAGIEAGDSDGLQEPIEKLADIIYYLES